MLNIDDIERTILFNTHIIFPMNLSVLRLVKSVALTFTIISVGQRFISTLRNMVI